MESLLLPVYEVLRECVANWAHPLEYRVTYMQIETYQTAKMLYTVFLKKIVRVYVFEWIIIFQVNQAVLRAINSSSKIHLESVESMVAQQSAAQNYFS